MIRAFSRDGSEQLRNQGFYIPAQIASGSFAASSLADENTSASFRRENYNGSASFAFAGARTLG